MAWNSGSRGELPIENFDLTKTYDIYCDLEHTILVIRDSKIQALRTWDPLEDEEEGVANEFLEIADRSGSTLWVATDYVFLISEAGTHPAVQRCSF